MMAMDAIYSFASGAVVVVFESVSSSTCGGSRVAVAEEAESTNDQGEGILQEHKNQ